MVGTKMIALAAVMGLAACSYPPYGPSAPYTGGMSQQGRGGPYGYPTFVAPAPAAAVPPLVETALQRENRELARENERLRHQRAEDDHRRAEADSRRAEADSRRTKDRRDESPEDTAPARGAPRDPVASAPLPPKQATAEPAEAPPGEAKPAERPAGGDNRPTRPRRLELKA